MALNVKPDTTYISFSFANGKKLRIIPGGAEIISTPGDTIIIEDSVFCLYSNYGQEFSCYTGKDLDGGNWEK